MLLIVTGSWVSARCSAETKVTLSQAIGLRRRGCQGWPAGGAEAGAGVARFGPRTSRSSAQRNCCANCPQCHARAKAQFNARGGMGEGA